MAGVYGYKPDGDKYWNVRDGDGQFAKGWGMASAVAKVAKKISDLKLPPITGDYSAAEKKKLRAQRRKIGQKMLDNGWQPDQVQNALSGSPTNWPALADIKSPKNMTPTVPKEPADSVSKAIRVKEKALAMQSEPDPVDQAPATPNKAPAPGVGALSVKDLKLPTIEGDDLTAQQKKNLRSQRRKLAQKMIDSGWTKDQILDKLGSDPKSWPALKDIKQVTPEDTPQTFAKVAPKEPFEELLGKANLLKSTPGMLTAGFSLHALLNKMKDGTANPAVVENRLDNFDKYELSASYINDPQDRAAAQAALAEIKEGLQDYLNSTPTPKAAPQVETKVSDAVQHLMDGFLSPESKAAINSAHNLLNSGATLAQNEKALQDLHEVKKYEIDYMEDEWDKDEAESSLAVLENALVQQNNKLKAQPLNGSPQPTTQIEKLAQGVGGEKALQYLTDNKPAIVAKLFTDMMNGKAQSAVSVPSNDGWGMDTFKVNPTKAIQELEKLPDPDLTPEQYTKMAKSLGVKSADYKSFKGLYGEKMAPSATAVKKPTATKAKNANDKYLKDLAKKLDFLAPTGGTASPVDKWPVVGSQKGSNPGALLQNPGTGEKFYVKTPKTESHVKSEVLANQLYAAFGVGAPEVTQVSYKGKPATSSKIIESSGESVLKKMKDDPEFRKEVQRGFAIDALLGNWDVAGASLDNIIVGKDGKPHRIDNGGSLNYRAQGAKKPGGGLSDDPEELYTLRNPSKNYQAAKLFGDMTDDEIQQSVNRLNWVSDDSLRAMAQGSMPGAEGKKLGETLVKRKQALLKEAKNLKPVIPVSPQKTKVTADFTSSSNTPGQKAVQFATPTGTPFKLTLTDVYGYDGLVSLGADNLESYMMGLSAVKSDTLEAVLAGQTKQEYLGKDAPGIAKPEVRTAMNAIVEMRNLKSKVDFLDRFNKLPEESKPYVKKFLSEMSDNPKFGEFNSWVPSDVPMGEAVPINPKEGDILPWTNPSTGKKEAMRISSISQGKIYFNQIGSVGSKAIDLKEAQLPGLNPVLAEMAARATEKSNEYDNVQKQLKTVYQNVDVNKADISYHAEFKAKAEKNAGSAAAYRKLSPEEKAKIAGMADSPRVKKALALKHREVAGARANTLPATGKHNLTTPQYHALRSYTGGGYMEINSTYRPVKPGFPAPKASSKADAALIDEVMKKPESLTKQEMIVTRGVSLDKFTTAGFGLPYTPKTLEEFMEIKDAMVGQVFRDDGYVSTSFANNTKKYNYTKHTPAFNKEIRLNIVVPPGTPALNVAQMSASGSHEREVVLDRGSEMVIQDMVMRGGKLHVDVVLVSTANTPKETV